MNKPVILTEPAFEDLRRNAEWWAKHRCWYDGFVTTLETLDNNAERCGLARENAEFSYEVRELFYGVSSRPTHRALFTIRRDSVLVLVIRHVAQQDVTPDDLEMV